MKKESSTEIKGQCPLCGKIFETHGYWYNDRYYRRIHAIKRHIHAAKHKIFRPLKLAEHIVFLIGGVIFTILWCAVRAVLFPAWWLFERLGEL